MTSPFAIASEVPPDWSQAEMGEGKKNCRRLNISAKVSWTQRPSWARRCSGWADAHRCSRGRPRRILQARRYWKLRRVGRQSPLNRPELNEIPDISDHAKERSPVHLRVESGDSRQECRTSTTWTTCTKAWKARTRIGLRRTERR